MAQPQWVLLVLLCMIQGASALFWTRGQPIRFCCSARQPTSDSPCLVYRYLALEGGGTRGIAYAGAVQALDDAGVLQSIQGFAGSSAGSIGSALLAAGFTGPECARALRQLDFTTFKDPKAKTGPFQATRRLLGEFGLFEGNVMMETVDNLIRTKTGTSNTTFAQLYSQTLKLLRITGTNLHTGKLVWFDKDTHPHMAVSLAVRISSSIPFYFTPVTHEGDLYVGDWRTT